MNTVRNILIKSGPACKVCEKILTRPIHLSSVTSSKLLEVGKLEPVKTQEKYEVGQFFLHRVLKYRGVTLFPWTARVYDRDVANNSSNSSNSPSFDDEMPYDMMKSGRFETQTYYQVLIDQRDLPTIKMQPEGFCYLPDRKLHHLYSVEGLDYTSHDDILPYTSTEEEPFHHQLFSQFFSPVLKDDVVSEFVARELLAAWRDKNQWLEMTEVRRETTYGIRVTVIPFYVGRQVEDQQVKYWWRYTIRLENLQQQRVQLAERHMRIFSSTGMFESTKGKGVFGKMALVLSPRQPAFQYNSYACLSSPSGHMWGTFRMERQDGSLFDIRIPPFFLHSKEDENEKTKPV
ncbi:polymerase delta-interacting protein 2-like [Dysidea avara]|uniref:polymerase delta-interacting protein 2-like n=1 Tax=Dysidea avara TaxID=196820 RepID=UPI00332FAC6A